jgi:3-hydroxybutyryl-CoA dehydrogenase
VTAATTISRVLVVGAGTMGSGIAQVIAEAGITAVLCDVDPTSLDRGMGAAAAAWERAVAKSRRSAEDIARFQSHLARGSLADITTVDLVIEAIVEKLAAKASLFSELAPAARPSTIFASNTSSISITALATASGRPDRFVGLHFFNPVPVLPLVEVVRGLATSRETVDTSVGFVSRLGKSPVVVHDAPGFVGNRILLPMINEAIFALQEGVASREAIDEVMKLGMAHPMGPLALADLIGLDVCLDILETLQRDFGDDKYRPSTLLRTMVAAGKLGRKTGEGFFAY